MFDRQQSLIERARRLIARLPSDVRWMLVVTDDAGEGPEPISASLSVTVPPSHMDSVVEILGPGLRLENDGLYERTEEGLEVSVEMDSTAGAEAGEKEEERC